MHVCVAGGCGMLGLAVCGVSSVLLLQEWRTTSQEAPHSSRPGSTISSTSPHLAWRHAWLHVCCWFRRWSERVTTWRPCQHSASPTSHSRVIHVSMTSLYVCWCLRLWTGRRRGTRWWRATVSWRWSRFCAWGAETPLCRFVHLHWNEHRHHIIVLLRHCSCFRTRWSRWMQGWVSLWGMVCRDWRKLHNNHKRRRVLTIRGVYSTPLCAVEHNHTRLIVQLVSFQIILISDNLSCTVKDVLIVFGLFYMPTEKWVHGCL